MPGGQGICVSFKLFAGVVRFGERNSEKLFQKKLGETVALEKVLSETIRSIMSRVRTSRR
jgi:hypothetical protein